jgi:hypothetical protein
MPPPDALFIHHMLAAVARVAELLTRIDRQTFDDDWVVQTESSASSRYSARQRGGYPPRS